MDYYMINGRRMPPVTSIDFQFLDLDSKNSGRLESTFMRRDRLRSNLLKVKIKHEMLTDAQVEMVKAFTSEEFFQYSGPGGTMICYRGDFQTTLRATTNKGLYWDVNFNLIEQ